MSKVQKTECTVIAVILTTKIQQFLMLWYPCVCLATSGVFFGGLPDSSVGKESTCSAGDPSSIPGLGRSAGEGGGYALQYSRASLVAQLVKNSSAMQDTWVLSSGSKDPLEKGEATENSMDSIVHEVAKSRTRLSDFHFTYCLHHWNFKWVSVFETTLYT